MNRLLVGVAMLASTRLFAQNLGGPPYYVGGLDQLFVDPGATLDGNPNLAGPFRRMGNIGVLERPHPDYAPVGARLGRFLILPSADTRVRYESNIFARDHDRQSDEIFSERIHVEADSLWARNAVNLYGDVQRRQYLHHDLESNTAFLLGGTTRIDADRLTQIVASSSYQQDVEPRTSVDGNFATRRPVHFSRAAADGQVTHEFGRLVTRASLAYASYDYRNGIDGLSRLVPQDYRDHDELRITGELDYALSPSFAPFLTASVNRFNYDQAKQLLPFNRDSQGYEVAAGVDFDLTKLIRARLQVGYLHQSFDRALARDVSTVSLHARLQYFVTPLLTLTAIASRNLRDSQLPQSPAYLDTSSVARADYELLRNLIITAEAGYEDADFRGVDRVDKRVTANIGGSYLANRHLTFRLQYVHLNQNSHGQQASVDYVDDVGLASVLLAI